MSRRVSTIARITMVEASRSRLLWLVAVFAAIGLGFAQFVSEVAIAEASQFQAAFLGALLRVAAVFAVSLFVTSSVLREVADKGIELILSLPAPRSDYYFGKLLGFAAVAAITAVTYALSAAVYAEPGQSALWGLSLFLELLIVIAASLLCVFTFNQVTWALSAVAGFYILARSMAAIQLMAHGPLVFGDSLAQRAVGAIVDAIAFALPDLELFTRSEWLAYGGAGVAEMAVVAAQTGIFVALLSGAALFDLYRKNL